MPVTSYGQMIDSINPRAWGEISDLSNAVIWSAVSTETGQPFTNSAGTTPGMMLFGFGVVRSQDSTGSDTVTYPTEAWDFFEGILMASDTIEQVAGRTIDPSGRFGYPPIASGLPGSATSSASPVSIIRSAQRICVPVEVTGANRGDPVHMRTTNGAGSVARGVFRNTPVAGETMPIPRARFLSFVAPPSAGQLATGYIVLEGSI